MEILTDFEYAQIICKEIKKINSKKTYNIESLNKDEKSKLISVLKTKLQLNDSQCLFLVDNYYHTKDLAKKLIDMNADNSSNIDIELIEKVVYKNLTMLNIVTIILLIFSILFLILGFTVVKEILYLFPIFFLFLALIIVFIYIPRIVLFKKVINKNKGVCKTIYGQLISVTLVNELLISFKFSHIEKVYYLKVKILVDSNIEDFFVSLINEHVSCDHYSVRKKTKEINNLFLNKKYSFNIQNGIIIDTKPNVIKQIINIINK